MNNRANLEADMKLSKEVIELCANEEQAKDFYRALSNMQWRKINILSDDERIIDRLKGEEQDLWSCSWRYAGGIIADIRNEHHGKSEDYMNFYCSGDESLVTETVERCFNNLGWIKVPYEDVLF